VIRNFLAFLAGSAAGMATNMAIIQFNSTVLFPMPAGLDPMADPEGFNAYLATLPAVAFVITMIAHLAQAGLGGWVAARLSGSRPVGMALLVGAFSMLGGGMALSMYEGPVWMVLELPLYLVVAWFAGQRVATSRQASSGA